MFLLAISYLCDQARPIYALPIDMPIDDVDGVIRPERSVAVSRFENARGRLAGAISGRQSFGLCGFCSMTTPALPGESRAASTSDAKQLFAGQHLIPEGAAKKNSAPPRALTSTQIID